MAWDVNGARNHQHFRNVESLQFCWSLFLPSNLPVWASSVISFSSSFEVPDVLVKCYFLCGQQARTWLVAVLAAARWFVSWFIARACRFWLNQSLWNQVPVAFPDRPDQGQNVGVTVRLAKAQKQFPRSWEAPYGNWLVLLSTPNAILSEEQSWRRKKEAR